MSTNKFTIAKLLELHAAGGVLESHYDWDVIHNMIDRDDAVTLAFVAKWKEYSDARVKFEQEVNDQFAAHGFPASAKF